MPVASLAYGWAEEHDVAMERLAARRASGGGAHRMTPPPGGRAAHSLVRLQAQAGNRAVASLLAPAVQRRRDQPGWARADISGDGWNAAAKDDVEGSGVRRIPVDDIPVGNQEAFSGRYVNAKTGKAEEGRTNEQAKTRESAAGRAIVLKPGTLNPNLPIDVLLHLHGYTSRTFDPYAGWRQSRKRTTKGANKNYRAVRDVDLDRIAQQIGAVNNPQILGILPQGVGHSQFAGLVPRSYVDAVLQRLEDLRELPKPRLGGRQINLVLSGHSGGGHTVRAALKAEVDADKARAKGRARGQGFNPVQVVLFEAINNEAELKTVTAWVDLHLNRVRAALERETNPGARAAAIAACPILRAYRSRHSYVSTYDRLDKHIAGWFADPNKGGKLGADRSRIKDRFKVEVLEGLTARGSHERVVGGLGRPEQGPLADALLARTDPSASKLVRSGSAAATPRPAALDVQVAFASRARPEVVAPSSLEVLRSVLRAAGLARATITSTARTPTDQARAMYQNLVGAGRSQGVRRQRELYGPAGDKIIDTFEALRDKGLAPAEIQAGMRDRILEIGPGKVSRHLADPVALNVLDVAPRSLGTGEDVARFETAAKALVGRRIERILTPGDRDPAEHLEIRPGGGGGAPSSSPPAPVKRVDPTPPRPLPAAAAQVPGAGFISDVNRTTLELLPKAHRERFGAIPWNDLDYPGAKFKVQDTSEANLERWRSKPGYVVFKVTKRSKDVWYIKGAHQGEARALLKALSTVRPGGGERRVNVGAAAILTQHQYLQDPEQFDTYIIDQLRDPPGEAKKGTRKMLNRHAAEKFVAMRTAAAEDGVVLSIGNAFREREQARKSAAAKDNPSAVASYSPHSLGLAMDLNLRTAALRDAAETTTKMTNTVRLLGAPAYKWMFQRGAEFGFYQFRNEPWHWEYNPVGFAQQFWADAPNLTPQQNTTPKPKR